VIFFFDRKRKLSTITIKQKQLNKAPAFSTN